MVISRTPFRISFFGGGTDYPCWFSAHGGKVLAATINKYCYITCRHLPPFFEHRIRVVYSNIENRQRLEEIQHPSVRETMRFLDFRRGVEIHHDGDLPARSGMGSSSSFTVGLLNGLRAMQGQMSDKRQLATDCIHIEQDMIRETVGSQDQISAAYGGFNQITFRRDGMFEIRPLTLSRERIEELSSHLMLFYTGIKRTASDVAQSYTQSLECKKEVLSRMADMVDEGVDHLNSSKCICGFGKLLHDSWELKRSLGKLITNSQVDDYYGKALAHGAIGGKILGAGGGGFLLLFVPPAAQRRVRQALSFLIHVPFKFEFSGSQIIFFEPEAEDYAQLELDRDLRLVERFRELNEEPSAPAKGQA